MKLAPPICELPLATGGLGFRLRARSPHGSERGARWNDASGLSQGLKLNPRRNNQSRELRLHAKHVLDYHDDFTHRNGGTHRFVDRHLIQVPHGDVRGQWVPVINRRWWMRTRSHCLLDSLRGSIRARRGLTLIELLAVILIILMVSAVALPTLTSSVSRRQISEAAAILQGTLVGARDKAIHDGQPSGIRLLPDPAFPIQRISSGTIDPYTILAYSRVIPIDPVPGYSEGRCTPVPPRALFWGPVYSPYPITSRVSLTWTTAPTFPLGLFLAQSPADPATGQPNAPTSWFWNIRIGDRLRLNNAGPWYTVIGPMSVGPAQGNTEMAVNVGAAGPLARQPVPSINGQPVEYLVLVNSLDDNNNGLVDEGFDGIDNNSNGLVDEQMEWESEGWSPTVTSQTLVDVTYTIRRRPAPGPGAREVALPTHVVVDATTSLLTRERSRLPVNPYTGSIDVVLNPDGTVTPESLYGSVSSFGMSEAFYQFWLAERADLADAQKAPSGAIVPPLLPICQPRGPGVTQSIGSRLQGNYALVTLFTRTGAIVVNEAMPFDDPMAAALAKRPYNANLPFAESQQGAAGS